MTIKNITHDEKRDIHKVLIRRGKKFFNVEAKSLDEAKSIKSKVLDFYEKNGYLPERRQIGMNPGRNGSQGLYDIIQPNAIVSQCTRCKDKVSYHSKAAYQRFLNADKECLNCRRSAGKNASWGKTKLFNITYSESRRSKPYRVSLYRNGEMFYQQVDALENAIELRDKVLDFYNTNDRLPSEEECQEQFGIKLRGNIGNKSPNISKPATSKFYEVKVSRSRKLYISRHETLSEAQAYRDEVIKYYDEHNALPTVEQVKHLLEHS